MHNNQTIQFKKQREIGDIITDTFKFIRENYKLLLSYLMKTTGPFFLVLVLAVGYYTWSVAGSPFENFSGDIGNFIVSFLVLGVALMLFYSALYGTILHYIKTYISNEGVVTEADVVAGVKKDFFKLLLLSFLSAILVIAGFIMLVIPGIFLLVPLSLAGAILVFKDYSVSESISYCFTLVKDHWWITFITLFIIGILVYIIGLVFQVPLIIYTVIKTLTAVQEGSLANPELFRDWLFIALQIFSSIIQYLLSIITIIAIAFIYFNLNEHKHLTGTYETIEKLGE